ncbi:hypothetical protein [Acidipropionibacterium timonense]|uniref:hypothetical protein n=1 Tax=Acidipropionibacterium timonense TaxID=2161818 RepID=UPI001030FA71|nr:hypothetical protein [Acidipropionibacterium timonense]
MTDQSQRDMWASSLDVAMGEINEAAVRLATLDDDAWTDTGVDIDAIVTTLDNIYDQLIDVWSDLTGATP